MLIQKPTLRVRNCTLAFVIGNEPKQCLQRFCSPQLSEADEERSRHAGFVDGRSEARPGKVPAGSLREGLLPPVSPALERLPRDAERRPQPSRTSWRDAVAHGRDERHDRREVPPAWKEPRRRRGRSAPTPSTTEAEPQPEVRGIAGPRGPTPWLAREVRDVQPPAAIPAATAPDLLSELTVELQKSDVQPGAAQDSLPQEGPPMSWWTQERSPLGSLRQALRGGFASSPRYS